MNIDKRSYSQSTISTTKDTNSTPNPSTKFTNTQSNTAMISEDSLGQSTTTAGITEEELRQALLADLMKDIEQDYEDTATGEDNLESSYTPRFLLFSFCYVFLWLFIPGLKDLFMVGWIVALVLLKAEGVVL